MLGDIFVEMGQPEQALVEYEAELQVSPNRFNSLKFVLAETQLVLRSPMHRLLFPRSLSRQTKLMCCSRRLERCSPSDLLEPRLD